MDCRIAVVDDRSTDVDYITRLVNEWADHARMLVEIWAFPSAEAFLFEYEGNKAYDLLLLDIEMGNMDGVELARRIRREDERVQIIFVTGFPDFLADGYEVSALHYLMKPVTGNRLSSVLDKAIRRLNWQERQILLLKDGDTLRVPVSDILSVEAIAHASVVTTCLESFKVPISISEMEMRLEMATCDDFVRCHRSYVVGIRHIRRISSAEVELDNGASIPLSRSQYAAVNQAFIRYFSSR